MSEHWSEVFRIIRGGLDGDTQKVRAYAELLVSKLEGAQLRNERWKYLERDTNTD